MKNLSIIIILTFLTSCSQSLKLEEAVKLTEMTLDDMKDEKYDNFSSYYTKDFFRKTPYVEWIKIQKNVKEQLGVIQSYELISSESRHIVGEQDKIELQYKVIHSKLNSKQTITVVLENGKYKIWGHHIKALEKQG